MCGSLDAGAVYSEGNAVVKVGNDVTIGTASSNITAYTSFDKSDISLFTTSTLL